MYCLSDPGTLMSINFSSTTWQPIQPSWLMSFLPFSASPWTGGSGYFAWSLTAKRYSAIALISTALRSGVPALLSSPQKRGMYVLGRKATGLASHLRIHSLFVLPATLYRLGPG